MTLSWPLSGQVSAYRVDRSAAGSGQWQPLACLPPGSATIYSRYKSPTVTEFRDESVALQPSTSYQYRITAVGPADPTGKRATNESIVLAATPARQSLVVGAVAGSSYGGAWASLSWPIPASGAHVKNILITSSYGARNDAFGRSANGQGLPSAVRVPSPRGTYSFSVTPLYGNGTSGATTTVSVVVP